MNYLMNLEADDFSVYLNNEDSYDWLVESDEYGSPVFNPDEISEDLHRDAF